MELFSKDEDDAASEKVTEETLPLCTMPILAYCLIPNPWHMVLWPEHDGHLSAFLQRLFGDNYVYRVAQMGKVLRLESTLRPRGRPKNC